MAEARGYSWPPFEPGNTLSLKAGEGSPRIVAPVAARIAAELERVAPWTRGASFAHTVEAWAWVEAQCHLLRHWLDEHGLLDADGVPRPASTRLDKLETRATSLRGELGLSPLALARLLGAMSGVDVPALESNYAALRTAGGALVEAARARGDLALVAGPASTDGGDEPDCNIGGGISTPDVAIDHDDEETTG